MNEMIRTHVLLPRDLVEEIDCISGQRGRSRFLAEAAAAYVQRLRRSAAAREVVGSLKDNHIPEWDTPESAAAWVRSLRDEWDRRLERTEAGQ